MTLSKHLIPVEENKEPVEFANQQLKVFWLPDEIKVEKDIQDVLVNFTPAEKHGVITTLKLFSIYETHAGSEYWGGRFRRIFNGAEFERMASVFSMFELAVHAPFYNKINQLLHIDTPEFYLSYEDNPVMKARIRHIGAMIDHSDDLVSLGAFSLVEGVILYSSFAYLKHYQSQGKNKLMNVVRGINFSVRDENLHSKGGAWAFKYLKNKRNLSPERYEYVRAEILETAKQLYEHECEIIEEVFRKGTTPGITKLQMQRFVQTRVNLCLQELGIEPMFAQDKEDVISSWFYKGINDFQFVDFFSGQGREYHREWDETAFKWN